MEWGRLRPENLVEKRCPECSRVLVVRVNSFTAVFPVHREHQQEGFLGCSGYPECRHTEPLPESVRMRMAGAQELPGF